MLQHVVRSGAAQYRKSEPEKEDQIAQCAVEIANPPTTIPGVFATSVQVSCEATLPRKEHSERDYCHKHRRTDCNPGMRARHDLAPPKLHSPPLGNLCFRLRHKLSHRHHPQILASPPAH